MEDKRRAPSPHRSCSGCRQSETRLNRIFKLCSSCKFVYYCSKRCQQADRALHAEMCRAKSESRILKTMRVPLPKTPIDICDCMHAHERRMCEAFNAATCAFDKCANPLYANVVFLLFAKDCPHHGGAIIPIPFCNEQCYARASGSMKLPPVDVCIREY